jgi:hypothetical protein
MHFKFSHFILGFLLISSGCTTADKQIDRLPYKQNALIVYSDKGRPIQDALEALCDKTDTGNAPNRSKTGITLVAGLGFNYAYEDPRASEAVLYMSRKYAEALQEEIKRCGVAVDVHINDSKNTGTREHLSESLARRKTDAMIQVSIAPEQADSSTALFIKISYLTLSWKPSNGGEIVTTGVGPSQKYKVAPDAPLALYARNFATVLRDNGYIGY